jgi:hypothetical protein
MYIYYSSQWTEWFFTFTIYAGVMDNIRNVNPLILFSVLASHSATIYHRRASDDHTIHTVTLHNSSDSSVPFYAGFSVLQIAATLRFRT